jgi:hypothetical protein
VELTARRDEWIDADMFDARTAMPRRRPTPLQRRRIGRIALTRVNPKITLLSRTSLPPAHRSVAASVVQRSQ